MLCFSAFCRVCSCRFRCPRIHADMAAQIRGITMTHVRHWLLGHLLLIHSVAMAGASQAKNPALSSRTSPSPARAHPDTTRSSATSTRQASKRPNYGRQRSKGGTLTRLSKSRNSIGTCTVVVVFLEVYCWKNCRGCVEVWLKIWLRCVVHFVLSCFQLSIIERFSWPFVEVWSRFCEYVSCCFSLSYIQLFSYITLGPYHFRRKPVQHACPSQWIPSATSNVTVVWLRLC